MLDSRLLRTLLKAAGEKLSGEWILVGGTLLPAVGIDVRTTVDVDLVGLGPKERAQGLELMTLAESVGLSVDVINQAAGFFLEKVKYKKADLKPLLVGSHATIYRPSFELYLKLKLNRLSESDCTDCIAYYDYCKGVQDQISPLSIRALVRKTLKNEKNPEKKQRLRQLLEHF